MRFVKYDSYHDVSYKVEVMPADAKPGRYIPEVAGTVHRDSTESWATSGGRGIRTHFRGYHRYWTAEASDGMRIGYQFRTRDAATKALLEYKITTRR